MLAGVKATPGTLQDGGASFATTHWSVVAQSALTDVPEATNALAQLCELYWPPIYSFIRRRGYAPSDAQDLTQSFFAFFLRTKAYARTDRLHGKFRSFLLASVKNFLADNWDRNQAMRRGGEYQFIPLDPRDSRNVLRRCDAIGFNTGTFIRIALGENGYRWRSEFVASRIATRRQAQAFRTTEKLSCRRQRFTVV